MVRIKMPLPPHMVSLPEGSRTAFRGQWAVKVGDHIETEVPEMLFAMWRTRFKAEVVTVETKRRVPRPPKKETENDPDNNTK